MKLLELEITNVRGIKSLVIRPQGQNLVIWGPNGSGKSAVVDSIDFLLTGRISRLTGPGTAGISLARHGPHIDATQAEAVVRAIVELPGATDPVELRRCMGDADNLECDAEVGQLLQPILALAERGQHVLTRREILKYIATQAGTRAQEIQQLLNISAAESVRQALVTVEHRSQDVVEEARNARVMAEGRVAAVVGLPFFDADRVLAHVTERRQLLGGDPIPDLRHGSLASGVARPDGRTGAPPPGVAETSAAVRTLRGVLTEGQRNRLSSADASVREIVERFRADPQLARALRHRDLLRLGVALIDETGRCPLCEAEWTTDELKGRVGARLEEAEAALAWTKELEEHTYALRASLEAVSSALARLSASLVPQSETETIETWRAGVRAALATLADPVAEYAKESDSTARVAWAMAPPDVGEWLDRIDTYLASASVPASPEQDAWDLLTRLDEALVPVEQASARLSRAEVTSRRASSLSAAYERARNQILSRLYGEVKDRFVALYRQLHGADEDGFVAELQPEGAGLDFKVGFHGRGVHPPQALHSEGHQDSMGICLYLALAERLTAGVIRMTILDDVMMSVDANHRRELSRLLANAFPERQLIITTHDRTWANQLRTEGVVTAKRCVQLYDWELATGPRVLEEDDLWTRIKADLDRADVPAAAHRLRRGAEEYFAEVCDALWAPVRFKLSGRLDLGDLAPAAMSRYREILKLGKRAANSWDQRDVIERMTEIESTSSQIFARSQVEQWAVNDNVHFNAWTNFTRADFEPVVEAFGDLLDVFRCSSCRTLLRVVADGAEPAAVQCSCGVTALSVTSRG